MIPAIPHMRFSRLPGQEQVPLLHLSAIVRCPVPRKDSAIPVRQEPFPTRGRAESFSTAPHLTYCSTSPDRNCSNRASAPPSQFRRKPPTRRAPEVADADVDLPPPPPPGLRD